MLIVMKSGMAYHQAGAPLGQDLERTGRAAAYLSSPAVNQGQPPRPVFLVQLEESRAEWRRRNQQKR